MGRSIPRLRLYVSTSDQSRSDDPPLSAAKTGRAPVPAESVYTWALMAMWEITITRRDGSRLRLSERRDYAPAKGDIFETADTGQIFKARIDAYHEENPSGWRPPFFQVAATEL